MAHRNNNQENGCLLLFLLFGVPAICLTIGVCVHSDLLMLLSMFTGIIIVGLYKLFKPLWMSKYDEGYEHAKGTSKGIMMVLGIFMIPVVCVLIGIGLISLANNTDDYWLSTFLMIAGVCMFFIWYWGPKLWIEEEERQKRNRR